MQILALARRTDFSEGIGLSLAITMAALTMGLTLAWISLQVCRQVLKTHSSY